MTKMRDLSYGQPLPEMVMDSLMELTGSYVSPNFQVSQLSNTQIRVPAGSDNDQVTIAINGRWRFNTGNADATHPGGAAATYDVYVTGSDNSFSGSPEVDSTTYSFGVQIRASGAPPATALYRKVATVDWDGSKITRVAPLFGAVGTNVTATDFVAVAPATAARNTVKPSADVVPLTVGTAIGQTANRVEVRDAANTLVGSVGVDGTVSGTSLVASGSAATILSRNTANATDWIVGLAKTGDTQNRLRVRADGRIAWGAGGVSATDVELYRQAAGVLRSDGSVQVGGDVSVTGSASKVSAMSASGASTVLVQGGVAGDSQPRLAVLASGMLQFGPGGASVYDSVLYRAGAGVLATDGKLALSPTATPTTAPFGVQFGNDAAANIYRGGVGLLKSDGALSAAGQVETTKVVPKTGTTLTLYGGTSGADGNGLQQGASGTIATFGRVFARAAGDASALAMSIPDGGIFARGGVYAPGWSCFPPGDLVLPSGFAVRQFGQTVPKTGYYLVSIAIRVTVSAGAGVTNLKGAAHDENGNQIYDVAGTPIAGYQIPASLGGDVTINVTAFVYLVAGQSFDWWMSRTGAAGTATIISAATGMVGAMIGTDGSSV